LRDLILAKNLGVTGMTCNEIREKMPDVAAGLDELTAEENIHLASCKECLGKLQEFRQTMALLDEWKAPEPSPYFDTRLQARMREEMAKPQVGWLHWFRRPALALALTLLIAVGAGVYFQQTHNNSNSDETANLVDAGPGTAVSDLQSLDNNHDLYADSDSDLLDDLAVQPDVVANP
jgi:hypothetical protein